MIQNPLDRRPIFWRVLFGLSAVVLYAVSVSGAAYEATTPVEMPHHVLLRKIFALGAFSLLGFLLARSRISRAHSVLAAAIAIGLYSYVIELGQIVIDQSNETFAEHGFDVASGVAGGALGAWLSRLLQERSSRTRVIEGAAIAAGFSALAWFYTQTYGPLDH